MSKLGHLWVPTSERAHLPRDVSQLCFPHGHCDVATNGSLRVDQCGGVDMALGQLAPAQLQDLSFRQL